LLAHGCRCLLLRLLLGVLLLLLLGLLLCSQHSHHVVLGHHALWCLQVGPTRSCHMGHTRHGAHLLHLQSTGWHGQHGGPCPTAAHRDLQKTARRHSMHVGSGDNMLMCRVCRLEMHGNC
jgi:hypothetical protein